MVRIEEKMAGGPHGRRCSSYNSAGVIIIALLKFTGTRIFRVYVSSALLTTPALLKYTGNLIHWARGYTWAISTHVSLKVVKVEEKMEGGSTRCCMYM